MKRRNTKKNNTTQQMRQSVWIRFKSLEQYRTKKRPTASNEIELETFQNLDRKTNRNNNETN